MLNPQLGWTLSMLQSGPAIVICYHYEGGVRYHTKGNWFTGAHKDGMDRPET